MKRWSDISAVTDEQIAYCVKTMKEMAGQIPGLLDMEYALTTVQKD